MNHGNGTEKSPKVERFKYELSVPGPPRQLQLFKIAEISKR